MVAVLLSYYHINQGAIRRLLAGAAAGRSFSPISRLDKEHYPLSSLTPRIILLTFLSQLQEKYGCFELNIKNIY
jgi:hypothetical protein